MVESAVQQCRDLLGDRLGDEKELSSWAKEQFEFCHQRCCFCGEHMDRMFVDFQDARPTGLCCEPCWTWRRTLPFDVYKAHSIGLKSGEKKYCGGEYHGSMDERILPPSMFEDRFSVCKRCFATQSTKRRVNWDDYVKSWTDDKGWRNVQACGPPLRSA
jgi:hypothetical protein